MRIKAYIQITRPQNAAIAFIVTLIGAITVMKINFPLIPVIIAGFAVVSNLMSGNAINDVYDVESDKISKPHRPIPSKRMTVKEAKVVAFILAIISIILSIFLNFICFLMATFYAFAWWLYGKYLKITGFPGNILVASGTAATILFGAFAVSNAVKLLTVLFSLLAFLLNLAREIVKGLEDIEADAIRNCRTIARIYGEDATKKVSRLIYVILLLFSLIPYLINLVGVSFLLIMIFVDLYIVFIIYKLGELKKENARKIAKHMKLLMLAGAFGLLLGPILP